MPHPPGTTKVEPATRWTLDRVDPQAAIMHVIATTVGMRHMQRHVTTRIGAAIGYHAGRLSPRYGGTAGCPSGLVCRPTGAGGRSPRDWLDGKWSEPRELAHVRGLIGRVGIPTTLQAVIDDQDLEIDLIGYDTEDEIVSAVTGLRRVSADQ